MLPTVIKDRPKAESDFQDKTEYQELTPETFFGGKPILHHHDATLKAWVSADQRQRLQFFAERAGESLHVPTAPESHGLDEAALQNFSEALVEAFVASNKLVLWADQSTTGIEIPYPSIALHAIKRFKDQRHPDDAAREFEGVYMQLEFSDGGAEDDDFEVVELTLVPAQSVAEEESSPLPPNKERVAQLFNAVSTCSNLNPDPVGEGDDDDDEDAADRIIFEGDVDHEAVEGFSGVLRGAHNGGLPPPFPGSSGWITAENVNEYFDADGNWIGGGDEDGEEGVSGELGEGAGRVRGREEAEPDGVNGHQDGGDSEAKRSRTE